MEEPPPVDIPPVDAWPSPNPAMGLLERDTRIASALNAHPPLVDEVEFADGRRVFAAVLSEDGDAVDAWVADGAGAVRRRVPRSEIAAIHRPTPEVALERRLARLVRIEADVDAGVRPEPATAMEPTRAEPETEPAPTGPSPREWTFDRLDRLADLPGAADVRWWPANPSQSAGSAWEPEDAEFGRTGLWALTATGLGHDARVVLQVTISAERVVFEHSPGYWGAGMEELHGHWRVYVNDTIRWEYYADPGAELGDAGRFPYESVSLTLGSGTHVVRWELQGCDTDATYFWGIDSIYWEHVTPPERAPTWGALKE